MQNWKVKIKDTLHTLGVGDKIKIRGWSESFGKIIKINDDNSALVNIEDMELNVDPGEVDSIEKIEEFDIPKEELKDSYSDGGSVTANKRAKLLEKFEKKFQDKINGELQEKKNLELPAISSVTDYSKIPPYAWEGIAKAITSFDTTLLSEKLEPVNKADAWSKAQHHMVQFMKGEKKDVDGQDHLAKSIINLLIIYNNDLKDD